MWSILMGMLGILMWLVVGVAIAYYIGTGKRRRR